MIENEMGYRGSKSVLVFNIVKEQRVDGSWWIKPIHLRCTLMGFERNYPIKIPSNQLNVKKFSTFNYSSNVNPWFWTGLIDGANLSLSSVYFIKISTASGTNFTTNHRNLAIVVWGINLTSSIGKSRFTKQISNMIQFPTDKKSVIIGLLLSDGWINIGSINSKNARLGFSQSLANSGYLLFVFNLLSHYCFSYPHFRIRQRSGIKSYGLEFLLDLCLVFLNYILYFT